jgi:hypothetical protein
MIIPCRLIGMFFLEIHSKKLKMSCIFRMKAKSSKGKVPIKKLKKKTRKKRTNCQKETTPF